MTTASQAALPANGFPPVVNLLLNLALVRVLYAEDALPSGRTHKKRMKKA